MQSVKRIWDLIKLEMDVSDGEGGGDPMADDNPQEEVADNVPALPPMDKVDHDPHNTTESSVLEVGGGGECKRRHRSKKCCTPHWRSIIQGVHSRCKDSYPKNQQDGCNFITVDKLL